MNCDVAIVGSGLVGASLGASLRGAGLRVTVLDADTPATSSPHGWDSRIYAISPGAQRFLAACGAWERIPSDRIARVDSMHVHGDSDHAEIEFSAYQAGLPELCFIVESREMERALREINEQSDDVSRLYGVRLTGLTMGETSARLELANDQSIETSLVVGADGAQSWVRDCAGIDSHVRPYGQQGVVANFETERHHDDIARQWFRPDGVLALLPLPGNRVSMVWSTWNDAADRLLSLPGDELEREVEIASRAVLGTLRLITAPRGFPLRLLRVSTLVRPRVALIGDAAHNVHPLAGQGVNLGFQDAEELAGVLRGRGAQDDCGDFRLLRRYARARSEPIALMQVTTDGLQRLFNNSSSGLKWLRNTGLRWTNGVVPLKGLLVEHALG